MKYHIEPIQWIVRGYEEGSYEEKSPFACVISLFKTSDTEAYAFGMHGTLDATLRQAILDGVKHYGITTIHFNHKGRRRAIHEKREA